MMKELKQKNIFKPELLDEILKEYKNPEELQKAILERALEEVKTWQSLCR